MKVWLSLLVFLFPLSVMASKARVESLQGARFLIDTQTLFINPAHINLLKQQITAEMGSTSNTSTPKAEGGILLEADLANKLGFYLGHLNSTQRRLRTAGGTEYFIETNPIEIIWGIGSFGASVYYSRDKKNTTTEEQKTLGGRLGFAKNDLEAFLSYDAMATSKNSQGFNYKIRHPNVNMGAEYKIKNFYLFADVVYAPAQMNITTPVTKTNADVELQTYEIGALNLGLSKPNTSIYYGLSFKYDVLDKNQTGTYNMTLPFVVGVEKKTTDWLTLRASLSQNILLSRSQEQTNASPNNKRDTIGNNTTVSAGLGLAYSDFALDGVVAASDSGDFNANNLLVRTGLSYYF